MARYAERKVKERTGSGNQARGFLMEMGIVVKKGIDHICKFLPSATEDLENGMSMTARDYLFEIYSDLVQSDEIIKETLIYSRNKSGGCQKRHRLFWQDTLSYSFNRKINFLYE